MNIEKNNVSAQGQVRKSHYIEIFDNGGRINVLFIGNSITRHEPKLEIGWANDWGMAASKKENDYVHVVVKRLEQTYGKVNYCIANCGEWEQNYYNDDILTEWKAARDFKADIVVIRIGENIWQVRDKFQEFPIASHYEKMVSYFCNAPSAKVVLTDLFWRNEDIDKAIYEVGKNKGYKVVHIGDLGEQDENMAMGQFWHEGVAGHPGDNGMKKIAERICDAIDFIHVIHVKAD